MATALTPRQAEILNLIEDLIEKNGFPPTRAELAKILGFRSTNAAEDHLRALAKKGYIELKTGASRGIRILQSNREPASSEVSLSTATSSNEDSFQLPLVGRVAAGSPILATENVIDEYQVPHSLFKSKPDYLLTVKGMSMRNIGIMDGDLLAVRKTQDALNGSIVVARIGEEVTVKRLQKAKNKIILLPENEDFEPIEVHGDEDFALEGIAVGLIRNTALH